MDIGTRVTGFEQLQATLKHFESDADALAALRPAMNAAGTKILKRSIDLAPRDRGGLVNSAGIKTTGGAKDLTVTIGYGTVYARIVHDNPRAGHTGGVSPSGQPYRHWAKTGQAKFLEQAMHEAQHTAWDDVGKGVTQWLRQHGR